MTIGDYHGLTIDCGLEFWELNGLINRAGWFDSNIRYLSRLPQMS